MPKTLESAVLFYTNPVEHSDKEYRIQLNEHSPNLYKIETQWGRRGGTLATGAKEFTDLSTAQKNYNKTRCQC